MKLTWQLQKKRHSPGFALGILVVVLVLIGGMQLWQGYNYQKQIDLYQQITLSYKLKIAENEIFIQRLAGNHQREFRLQGMDIKVDNDTIIFIINNREPIERKFILPQRLEA